MIVTFVVALIIWVAAIVLAIFAAIIWENMS